MKKSMLFLMVFVAGAVYARAGVVLPVQRMALSASMLESTNAYEQAGNKRKSAEYRKAALDFYPVGDQAHVLARQLGVKLDDEQTFNKFVSQADRSMRSRNYANALSDYLMALEIRQPVEVYEKLIAAYQALGNREMADGLRALIGQAPMQPMVRPATPARPATPMIVAPMDEYQAEAVQDPVYDESDYEEDSATYEDEYQEAEHEEAMDEEEAAYQEAEIISD
ncbi:MAG: hypothetical protein ACRCY4_00380 [Brevinema sp.]